MMNGGKIPMHAYVVATTSVVYKQDIVCLRAAGKVATLKTTTGATNILGVAANYAATGETVFVYDDPMTIFEVQSDSATDPGATTALAHWGATAESIITTGNTTTKISKHELDYTAITTATAGVLKILGVYQGLDNDETLAYGRYLVMLNKHIWGYAGAKAAI